MVSIAQNQHDMDRSQRSNVNQVALINAVSLACHKARSFDDAVRDVLRLVAENLMWPIGHAFYVDEARIPGEITLVSSRIWYQSATSLHTEFRRVTEAFTANASGMSLAPQWREDVRAMHGFARANLSTSPLNVAAAFNIPVVHLGNLIAVAEFFHTESAPCDNALLEVASMIGHHLAQAYERTSRLANSRAEIEPIQPRELAERNQALQELAAGVSHEINNPLTIALRHLHLARSAFVKNRTEALNLESHFDIMEASLIRIAGIVGSMRQFCQLMEIGSQTPVTAGDILHKALSFCAEHIESKDRSITIITSGDPSIEISANISQICNAFVEVIKNAIDAVSEQTDQTDKRVDLTLAVVANRVHFTVTDNGPGIPAELANRVMEPFFTTKQVGQGAGLGLSSAKGIIESHRGMLTFESRPGRTTFLIDLPCAN